MMRITKEQLARFDRLYSDLEFEKIYQQFEINVKSETAIRNMIDKDQEKYDELKYYIDEHNYNVLFSGNELFSNICVFNDVMPGYDKDENLKLVYVDSTNLGLNKVLNLVNAMNNLLNELSIINPDLPNTEHIGNLLYDILYGDIFDVSVIIGEKYIKEVYDSELLNISSKLLRGSIIIAQAREEYNKLIK